MNMYKRLLGYVPERKKYAYYSMVLSAIAVLIYMIAYYYLWKTLEALVVNTDITLGVHYSIIVISLLILRGFVAIVGIMSSHYLGFRLETNLRKAGLYKLLDASFSFFDKSNSGQIRKIIDDNAGNTHKTVAHLIPDNITALLTPVGMLALTFFIDYRLGILLVITFVVGVFQFKAMYNSPDLMDDFSEALERMSASTVEYVRGMQVIKLFGVSVDYYKSLIDSINDYRKNVYAYSQSCRKPYVGFQVLFNSFYAFAVPFAALFILRGESATLLLAKLVFFAIFSDIALLSFMAVMFAGSDNHSAMLAIDRLEELMGNMDDAKLIQGSVNKMGSYDIEFSNVSFKYDEKYVLKDFNLKLNAHKTYALVGPSGSGKSTIAKLISGFYPIDKGDIRIGGKNITNYSEKAIQENIAFVFQNSKLFKTTIYENVKIGNPEANRQEVLAALKAAQCTSILDKFPDKENTIIGSKGVYLSRGEMQRVAIARAILKDAEIIILDEASAATDPENEYEIQQAFSNLMKGKTVIMIAHRLSTITNVDEIMFVENGAIIERGNHASLMAKNGRYKDLQDMYHRSNEWRIA
ncbi:ABC transporter ATP-binding protein [Facklamia miroungae]|nr:ABC transporter ATP-binding protein [Facklamia miroungae]